jgi:hypothetical protein
MTNIDTPHTQKYDQHRYPSHTEAWPTSIPLTHRCMTNIDTPHTQRLDQHRYTSHTDVWPTSIPSHTDVWPTSIPLTHRCMTNIDTPSHTNAWPLIFHAYYRHCNTKWCLKIILLDIQLEYSLNIVMLFVYSSGLICLFYRWKDIFCNKHWVKGLLIVGGPVDHSARTPYQYVYYSAGPL